MTLTADIIKQSEGLRLTAYRDGGGTWTIGYGHTGAGVSNGVVITEIQANRFLEQDIAWASDTVRRSVRVPLTTEQHATLVSLTYNIGSGGFRRSTVLRRLNMGNYTGAADAILMWNKITVDGVKTYDQGLANRRERERALFLKGTHQALETGAAGGVTGGEAKPLRRSKTQWLGLSGVLTARLTAWGQLHRDAPEIIEQIAPYAPYLLGFIFLAVMFNRYMDSRKGIH